MRLGVRHVDILCLLTVLLAAGVSAYGTFRHVATQKQELETARAVLSERRDKLLQAKEDAGRLREALGTARSRGKWIENAVPPSGQTGLLLKDIGSLMEKRRITLVSLQPQSPLKEAPYQKVPLRMLFRGRFVDIHLLLKDLETMDRPVILESVLITAPNQDRLCQVELTAHLLERDPVR